MVCVWIKPLRHDIEYSSRHMGCKTLIAWSLKCGFNNISLWHSLGLSNPNYWWYGYEALWSFSKLCLGYQNPNWGVHTLKICLWSIVIDSKTLVEGYASWNPNQGGYDPKIPYGLTFHLDGLQTLVSSNYSPIVCLMPLLY